MIKKTIPYTDYDGNERTEDFYFNLTEAETVELNNFYAGGLVKELQKIVNAKSEKAIIAVFKDLILRAYGEKSPDGRRFVKNQDLRDSFSQTEAYSILFMELATNTEAGVAFCNGIFPKDKNANAIPNSLLAK